MPKPNLTDPQKRMLLAITAKLEALHEPYRCDPARPVDPAHAAVLERRERYHHGPGLRFSVGGSGADRTSGHRDLRALEDSGLIVVRTEGTKQLGIKLAKHDHVFAMCPLRLITETWRVLTQVAQAVDNPKSITQAGCVYERDAIGKPIVRSSDNAVVEFITSAMPHLIAGYLETYSDTAGVLGWAVTDLGRKAIAAGRPRKARDLPEFEESLNGFYSREFNSELDRRQSWEPESRSHVAIPLTAGLWMDSAEWEEYRSDLARSESGQEQEASA